MIYKDENGIFKFTKIPKNYNQIYAQALVKFLNSFDPIFEKARDKSEFDFILTLLNIKGIQPVNLDPFETTQDIVKTILDFRNKLRDSRAQIHVSLLLYGLIIEASLPYELIFNLINIIGGNRYQFNNFPDKETKKGFRPLTPGEKIDKIEEKAKNLRLEKHIEPLKEILNREIRNAVFHSDYCYFKDQIVIPRSSRSYNIDEIKSLINKTLAYYETIDNLRKSYKLSYTKPKTIDVPSWFSNDPELKAVIMVRKKTGVIGLKDNWTEDQIRAGKIQFRCCTILPYEQKMIKQNPCLALFPPNRIDSINSILKIFPNIIRKHLYKIANRIC